MTGNVDAVPVQSHSDKSEANWPRKGERNNTGEKENTGATT